MTDSLGADNRLSEVICRRCRIKYGGRDARHSWDHGFGPCSGHEAFWENSAVCCPSEVAKQGVQVCASTKEQPPKWCPYIFEHAVSIGAGIVRVEGIR